MRFSSHVAHGALFLLLLTSPAVALSLSRSGSGEEGGRKEEKKHEKVFRGISQAESSSRVAL